MNRKEEIRNTVEKYEKEYMEFMGINNFPRYKLELFEIKIGEANADGYEAPAQALYNPKTDEYKLRICINLELMKYIVFHEFTHILDVEKYAKNDANKYMALSGYTEYHASQIELMVLLGIDSGRSTQFEFNTRIETFPFEKSVKEYLCSKHQFILDMMGRCDFPKNIETLKTTLGCLYNYFGLRSICKIYAKNYIEQVDNTVIIKTLPPKFFPILDFCMQGEFDKTKVEMSFEIYSKLIFSMIKKYKLL